MKQRVSPHNILMLVSASLLLVAILAVYLSTSHPWLGLEMEASKEGAKVVRVIEGGPAEYSGLTSGEVIIGVSSIDLSKTELIVERDLMLEPDDHELYVDYFLFFEKQDRINSLLKESEVILNTLSGHNYLVSPVSKQPFTEISFYFWLQLLSGFSVLMMSVMVWVYSRDQMGATLYMLAAIGLLIAIFPSAIYTTRELALDGQLFELLSRINQFGVMIFCGYGTAIFWYYPKRVGRFPFLKLVPVLIATFLALNYLHVFDSLHPAVHWPIVLWLILDITLASIQWRRTTKDPVERAQIKWFVLAWFIGPVVYVALNVIPILIGLNPC